MSDCRILVVEDDALVAWSLKKALGAQHLEVELAGSAADARETLERSAFELAFVDVHLPDASGLDLLREIHERSPDTRVVVLSSDGTESNRRRAYDGGAWLFIEKPFEMAEIHRVLGSALESHPEKRRHERDRCRVPVRIAVIESTEDESGVAIRYVDATTVDVAAGGMRLHTEHPLEPGQWVQVHLPPSHDPPSRQFHPESTAQVVWVLPEGSGFTAGLRYPGAIV